MHPFHETGGSTPLAHVIDKRIVVAAVDGNPDRDGVFSPGTDNPIISEGALRSIEPDYYLMLSLLFREKHTLLSVIPMNFPLATIEIVGRWGPRP